VQPGADALPWSVTLIGSAIALAALAVVVLSSDGGTFLVRKRTGASTGQTPDEALTN
jgi:hypothetical protein